MSADLAQMLGRLLWTSNPFYVISAGLFLLGLRLSFNQPASEIDTWALMTGLTGYTLLLAVTGCGLIRTMRVWDDARTVMLLVVLMFLATSVTFDDVLINNPRLGVACGLIGLAFSVAVSEGLLRGSGLKLPAGFRIPYYLALALFFLYPLALRPLTGIGVPRSEELQWALFGFSCAAALVVLTLIPAARAGAAYVADSGGPWRWPLYPWVLFGLLGLAVPARAYLLCVSIDVNAGGDRLIFGPYFLVPFGLAVAALLLEIGTASASRAVRAVALLTPAALVALSAVGQSSDPVFEEFLQLVRGRLGGGPLWLTLIAAIGFYAYATARRAGGASDLATAAVAGLAFIGPDGPRAAVDPVPLFAAGALLLIHGVWRRTSGRVLAGAAGIALGAVLSGGEGQLSPVQSAVAVHVLLAAGLLVGALFGDRFAVFLREATPVLLGIMAFGVLSAPTPELPPWLVWTYPAAVAALLMAYGALANGFAAWGIGTFLASWWAVTAAAVGYMLLRRVVPGLDFLSGSLAVFGVAVLISFAKSKQPSEGST